jgi:hypothetical protein
LKFLLDENFPLQLYRRLLDTGREAEHVIALGQRGAPDTILRDRLVAEELVLLTHDTEFERLPAGCRSQVIVSRVPQRLPIAERVEIWAAALERFARQAPTERLFDLLPSGEIVAWAVDQSPDGVTVRRTTRRF